MNLATWFSSGPDVPSQLEKTYYGFHQISRQVVNQCFSSTFAPQRFNSNEHQLFCQYVCWAELQLVVQRVSDRTLPLYIRSLFTYLPLCHRWPGCFCVWVCHLLQTILASALASAGASGMAASAPAEAVCFNPAPSTSLFSMNLVASTLLLVRMIWIQHLHAHHWPCTRSQRKITLSSPWPHVPPGPPTIWMNHFVSG